METNNLKTKKMETKTINKTDNAEQTIYHNSEKTASDIVNVQKAKSYIDLAVVVLQDHKINPKHAANILQGSFGEVKREYISLENQKLDAAATLLGGNNALLDVARERIEADVEKIISILSEKIRPLSWEMHNSFNHIDFVDGAWSVRNGFKAEIQKLNSINLTDPAETELYKKNVKLVELLNELKGDGGTLMGLINNLVSFDASTKVFSVKYRNFDKNNVVPAYF